MRLIHKEIDSVLIHLRSTSYPLSKEIVSKIRIYLCK